MRTNDIQCSPGQHELDENIRLLAHMESTHSPMVSCYLSLRAGRDNARDYLLSQKQQIAARLSGFEQQEFEQAYDSILNNLETSQYDCKALAYFSRSFKGGHFFRVLQLDILLKNSVTVSAAPNILPLMLLRHEYGQYLQASVSEGAIEICELGLGTSTMRGMANLISTSSEESRLATARHMLERTMRSRPQLDVILVGEQSFIHGVYNNLPRLLRRRVIQLIPRQPGDTDFKILKVGKLTHKRHREYLSGNQLNEAIKSGHVLEQLTTGVSGSLRALNSYAAGRLYVTADDLDLNAMCIDAQKDSVLDVIRLAIQQAVPIHFVSSNRIMHQAEGIACLVADKAVMHRSGFRPAANSLDMVA